MKGSFLSRADRPRYRVPPHLKHHFEIPSTEGHRCRSQAGPRPLLHLNTNPRCPSRTITIATLHRSHQLLSIGSLKNTKHSNAVGPFYNFTPKSSILEDKSLIILASICLKSYLPSQVHPEGRILPGRRLHQTVPKGHQHHHLRIRTNRCREDLLDHQQLLAQLKPEEFLQLPLQQRKRSALEATRVGHEHGSQVAQCTLPRLFLPDLQQEDLRPLKLHQCRPGYPRVQRRRISIPDLVTVQVSKMQKAIQFLIIGLKNRVAGSTQANAKSSRSHSIFQICMEKYLGNQTNISCGRSASFNSDLVGSEKFKIPSDLTALQKEICIQKLTSIDGSLFCLGNCISTLIDNLHDHIPLRNSKLTCYLNGSLLGQGKTRQSSASAPPYSPPQRPSPHCSSLIRPKRPSSIAWTPRVFSCRRSQNRKK